MGGVTIYRVAEHAAVSIASVSRVVHGQPGVSAETRRRIQASMRELGYVPNDAAQGLAGRRHGVVGLVFADLDDPSEEAGHESLLYSDEIIRGAERAARAHGHSVLLVATHAEGSRDRLISLVGKMDALVILAGSVPTADIRLLSRLVPVALLAAERRVGAVDQVRADNAAGMRAVVDHLISGHGFGDLAFIGGPEASPDAKARFRGYQAARLGAGLAPAPRPDVTEDFTERGGRQALRRLLSRRAHPPRAIVASNDQMAVGAIGALTAKGLRVPDDVAVTGFDDIQLARLLTPGLTTVHQPMRQLGQECVHALLARIGNPDAEPANVLLPTHLVVRTSCGCPPSGPSSDTRVDVPAHEETPHG